MEKGMSPISARIVARDDNTLRAEIGLIPFSGSSSCVAYLLAAFCGRFARRTVGNLSLL